MYQSKEGVESQICLELRPIKKLCSVFDRLDLEAMLYNETKAEPIGRLSDYNDPNCPFCNLISKSVCLAWGSGWDSARLCSTTSTPPQLFIQSRSPLSVKKDSRIEHTQPRLLLAINQKPPSLQHNRAPLRDIYRMKDRFIIAEIESLPDDPAASVSKVANFLPRPEVGNQFNVELMKSWLEKCQKHKHSREVMGQKDNNLFEGEHPFRLIDVIDECLTQKIERCDYAALSYVWGQIPHTVRDAMEFTRAHCLLVLWRIQTEVLVLQHLESCVRIPKCYLGDRIGINFDLLLAQSLREVQPSLSLGELGFFGPYLPSMKFRLRAEKGKRVRSLEVSTHRGEFRFDSEAEEVDELVVIVAANTITKQPDTQSILLGLTTRDGISSRVGIGFIYYSKGPSAVKPQWQYSFFKVR